MNFGQLKNITSENKANPAPKHARKTKATTRHACEAEPVNLSLSCIAQKLSTPANHQVHGNESADRPPPRHLADQPPHQAEFPVRTKLPPKTRLPTLEIPAPDPGQKIQAPTAISVPTTPAAMSFADMQAVTSGYSV